MPQPKDIVARHYRMEQLLKEIEDLRRTQNHLSKQMKQIILKKDELGKQLNIKLNHLKQMLSNNHIQEINKENAKNQNEYLEIEENKSNTNQNKSNINYNSNSESKNILRLRSYNHNNDNIQQFTQHQNSRKRKNSYRNNGDINESNELQPKRRKLNQNNTCTTSTQHNNDNVSIIPLNNKTARIADKFYMSLMDTTLMKYEFTEKITIWMYRKEKMIKNLYIGYIVYKGDCIGGLILFDQGDYRNDVDLVFVYQCSCDVMIIALEKAIKNVFANNKCIEFINYTSIVLDINGTKIVNANGFKCVKEPYEYTFKQSDIGVTGIKNNTKVLQELNAYNKPTFNITLQDWHISNSIV